MYLQTILTSVWVSFPNIEMHFTEPFYLVVSYEMDANNICQDVIMILKGKTHSNTNFVDRLTKKFQVNQTSHFVST